MQRAAKHPARFVLVSFNEPGEMLRCALHDVLEGLRMMPASVNRLPLLAALALLLAATGCEKIITPKLNTSASQLVIEGNLADNGQPCLVSLTTSTDYTNTNTFPPVSGATVTLTDNAGHSETLPESPAASGQYRGATVLGVPGRSYTLRVETGGSAYVATSTLPGPVVP
ncbi:DUF4249 family protein, partial [Salmonella enterica]|nr:DUF4249 family protein [Salmonella enterica]